MSTRSVIPDFPPRLRRLRIIFRLIAHARLIRQILYRYPCFSSLRARSWNSFEFFILVLRTLVALLPMAVFVFLSCYETIEQLDVVRMHTCLYAAILRFKIEKSFFLGVCSQRVLNFFT